jgi:hypothetical protein
MSGIGVDKTDVARKGEVWDQQSNICTLINSIRKLVNQLEERLAPVLQPQPPQGETAETPKPPACVPMLLKQLTANRDDLHLLETRIGSLLERLEL